MGSIAGEPYRFAEGLLAVMRLLLLAEAIPGVSSATQSTWPCCRLRVQVVCLGRQEPASFLELHRRAQASQSRDAVK